MEEEVKGKKDETNKRRREVKGKKDETNKSTNTEEDRHK